MCVLAVPGAPEDQSSYRSELAGLYGIAMMVQVICEHFGITSGGIEVGCDGQIAIQRVFGEGPHFNPAIKDADYDILKWTWRHVAGHQDDDGIKELDRWAMLNIEMDNLAKVYWKDMSDEQVGNCPITA
jgi:hypothetical protein